MRFLTFDTSLDKTYVTLFESDKILDTQIIETHDDKYHSAYLIQNLVVLLKSHNLTMKDIEAIGVNIGPGSFTGIRACLAIARVVAQQLEIPLVGISSLEILSQLNKENKPTVVVMDARKNMCYYATPTGEEAMKYRTEYVMADADGNGILDLVIREPRQWYFYTYDYEKDEMVNFAALSGRSTYRYDMRSDGNYIYWDIDGTQYEDGHYELCFWHFYLDEDGEEVDIERFWIEAISLILRTGSESDGCQNGCQQQHIEFADHACGSVRTSDTLSSP